MTTATVPVTNTQALLEEIATWGNLTTIIIHGGSVFEFKGPFPDGSTAHGYYNLKGAGEGSSAGFEGHLDIKKIAAIEYQEKQHRGRDSYAFVFLAADETVIFKVFLGRDSDGNIYKDQLSAFKTIQTTHQINGVHA